MTIPMLEEALLGWKSEISIFLLSKNYFHLRQLFSPNYFHRRIIYTNYFHLNQLFSLNYFHFGTMFTYFLSYALKPEGRGLRICTKVDVIGVDNDKLW